MFRRFVLRTLLVVAAIGSALPPAMASNCKCSEDQPTVTATATAEGHPASCSHCVKKAYENSCCQPVSSSDGAPEGFRCLSPGGCDCEDCGCHDRQADPLTSPTKTNTSTDAPTLGDTVAFSPASLTHLSSFDAAHQVATRRLALWRAPPIGVQANLCVWTI